MKKNNKKTKGNRLAKFHIKRLNQQQIYKILIILVILLLAIKVVQKYQSNEENNIYANITSYDSGIKSSNPILVYEYLPNYADSNSNIQLNNKGFRDNSFTIQKKELTDYRIAFVGDSVTFGLYVNDSDKIVTELLEKKLNQNSNRTYEVMNFGIGGYSTLQQMILLNQTVMTYNPDLIIFLYVTNDIDEEYLYQIEPWFTKESYNERTKLKHEYLDYGLTCNVKDKIKRTSIYNKINNMFVPEQIHTFWMKSFDNLYGDYCKVHGLNVTFKHINKIREDTPTLFVSMPFLMWGEDYYFKNIHSLVHNLSNENNFLYYDLIPDFLPYDVNMFRIEAHPTDKDHPNELGHELMANKIYEFIVDKKLI